MISTIIQTILSVIIPGLILAYLTKRLNQQGPKLVYYVSAATWFTNIFPQPQTPPRNLHVITIAIRNNGNQVAKNVDISHLWPSLHFQVVPFIQHEIVKNPSGANIPWVLRLASLNPGETTWISYLFDGIVNQETFIEYVRSEEVLANRTNMILNPIFPASLNKFLAVLLILGIIFIGFIIWWAYPPLAHTVQWLISYPRG